MAYTNFQHCTANEYKNIIYNQETNNKIKILFNNVELEDADEYCESFEVVSRVIPNGSKIFMLENLVSQEATLVLHNIDTSIIQDQVSISIGTLVSENTYEYVPIGIYNLQEIPTTDNGKTTIKLRDNSVKLDFNYNAKPLIDEHGGTATKLQILQDICSQANITCNVSSFIGSSDLIGIYDNTITGRQYVAYLAGSAGAIPIITRSGALDFKYLNNLSTIEIPIEIVERYTNAENFKISRVLYEDAIRKYEHGNETYDTLFLNSANPYISSQSQVDSIYNIVNNFEINSFTTGSILGNPAIDSYDLIQITDYDNTVFKTFANNTLRYNGKMINTFASEISFERKKENVSLKSGATFKKWAKTEIDNANAQITIQAGQIDEIEQELSSPTSTKQGEYFDLQDALDSPLIDFSLYGETQQDSTTGKNMLSLVDGTYGTDITALVNNGEITLNGSASSNKFITIPLSPYISLTNGEQYTISTNNVVANSNVRFRINDTGSYDTILSSSNATQTITYDNSTPVYGTSIKIRVASGTTLTNYKLKPMIEKGNTMHNWEPYTNGASPNPNYPQEIHNVSGDNTIEICGKNLYNKETSLNNTTFNTNTGNIGSNSNYITSDFIRVIPNTEYYIYGLTVVGGYNKDKTFISMIRNSNSAGAFTTPENCYYIRIRNYNQLSTEALQNETSNITYLVVGNEATTYEAYTGNSQLISLGVENLFDKDNVNKLNAQVQEGHNSSSSNAKTLYIPCQPNTTYTISKIASQRFRIATTNDTPTTSSTNYGFLSNDYGSTLTITTNSTAKYLCVYYFLNGTDTLTEQQILDTIQIEKSSKANSYSPYGTTPIELNKISTYQDYIYKDNDIWYLHKEIGKVVLNGSESWSYNSQYTFFYTTSFTLANTNVYTNYYKYYPTITGITGNYGCSVYQNNFRIKNTDYTVPSDFKTWLSTHNTIVYYVLSTPTDTEITDTTLLEQLNRLMTLPLYKNMTHITLTPNDLQPTMKIEYYRDTSLNNTFVPKSEMSKYYTKTETIAQIQIGNSSIQQNVAEIQTTLDSNGETINTISNQVQTLQSSTSLQINAINSQLENGVEKLTNSLVKIDANGINTSKQGETFNTQITNKTFEVRDGNKELAFIGYNNEEKRTIARMDDLESKRAIIGVHRTEVITRQGRKRTAGFYVGGDN